MALVPSIMNMIFFCWQGPVSTRKIAFILCDETIKPQSGKKLINCCCTMKLHKYKPTTTMRFLNSQFSIGKAKRLNHGRKGRELIV